MSPTLLQLADHLLARGGVLVRLRGELVPFPHAEPLPHGLLGVRFGPDVDAVAVTLGRRPAPVLAVDRWGEAIVADPAHHRAPAVDASLVLDLARRSLGLATAPPEQDVGELVELVWLDRMLDATLRAPLGEPPAWPTLARLHPGARCGPPESPEILRHRVEGAPSWPRLRTAIIESRVRWPPVSPALAGWFDDGSLCRHTLAVHPHASVMLSDLHELLRPSDAERIDAALSPR